MGPNDNNNVMEGTLELLGCFVFVDLTTARIALNRPTNLFRVIQIIGNVSVFLELFSYFFEDDNKIKSQQRTKMLRLPCLSAKLS